MSELLEDLGVETLIDDILVYARTNSELYERLKKTYKRIKQNGIKLNREKCEFIKSFIEYFRHKQEWSTSKKKERIRAILELLNLFVYPNSYVL